MHFSKGVSAIFAMLSRRSCSRQPRLFSTAHLKEQPNIGCVASSAASKHAESTAGKIPMQINRRPQLKPQSYLNNYTGILKISLWPDLVHTDYLESKVARIRPVSAECIKDTHTNITPIYK